MSLVVVVVVVKPQVAGDLAVSTAVSPPTISDKGQARGDVLFSLSAFGEPRHTLCYDNAVSQVHPINRVSSRF